jgi:hypothetical protein
MKIVKRFIPLLIVFIIFTVLGISCSGKDKSKIEDLIKNELNLLKNLDSDTVQKYVSYTELFPDASQNSDIPDDVQEVFSLFFEDFDYKIQTINVDTKANTATADLRLTTIDAEALARDYAKSLLQYTILMAADTDSQDTDSISPSTETRYLLLNKLLKQNEYETIQTDCTIQLVCKDDKTDSWEIKRTHMLENNLVGGLVTYLSDNQILSPEETLSVYLDTLKEMDSAQMSNYLGISSLLSTDDESKQQIAAALVEQVHLNFDYEITDTQISNGSSAIVEADITTFDSNAILKQYQEELDTYLASADAVIDGSSVRSEKSYEMLSRAIEENAQTTQAEASFHLTNDGISWNLADDNEELGNAIFGTLTTTPVEEDSES